MKFNAWELVVNAQELRVDTIKLTGCTDKVYYYGSIKV